MLDRIHWPQMGFMPSHFFANNNISWTDKSFVGRPYSLLSFIWFSASMSCSEYNFFNSLPADKACFPFQEVPRSWSRSHGGCQIEELEDLELLLGLQKTEAIIKSYKPSSMIIAVSMHVTTGSFPLVFSVSVTLLTKVHAMDVKPTWTTPSHIFSCKVQIWMP